jgi:hypothetical protein
VVVAAEELEVGDKSLICPLRAPGTAWLPLTGIADVTAVALLRNVQRKIANSTRVDLLLSGYGRPVPVWTDLPGADSYASSAWPLRPRAS